MITKEQIQAARGYLGWDRPKLSEESGVSITHIANIENGKTESPRAKTVNAIERVFVKNGIGFKDGGVFPKENTIYELHGQQGFWDFYDDVYETVKEQGGDLLVHNVEEAVFIKWLGDRKELHRERMSQLDNFQQKVTLKEGDTNFSTDFGAPEYRWITAEQFSPTPFYVYGSKLAMFMFKEDDVDIIVIDHPQITESYTKDFWNTWEKAKTPEK